MEEMILILAKVLLLILVLRIKAAESTNISLPGCQDNCGGVPIPYPFGIGHNCSMEGFELNCSSTNNGVSTPFLGNLTILDINLSLGQARVNMPVSYQCYNTTHMSKSNFSNAVNWSDTPFLLNPDKNIFTVTGCNSAATLATGNSYSSYVGVCGCVPLCYNTENLTSGNCSGLGCCQSEIPKISNEILFEFFDYQYLLDNSTSYNFTRCVYAMLMEKTDFFFNTSYAKTEELIGQTRPVVIDWAIGNKRCDTVKSNQSSYACRSTNSVCLNSSSGPGYLCNCSDGYDGNPYIEGGCLGHSSLSTLFIHCLCLYHII